MRRQPHFESDRDRDKTVDNHVAKELAWMIIAIAAIPAIILLMSLIAAHGQLHNW